MSVGAVTDIAWSPDSQRVVVAGTGSGGIHGDAFMIQGGASVGSLVGHSKPMLSIDYKPDRPFRVATASEDGKANLYEGPPFKTVSVTSTVCLLIIYISLRPLFSFTLRIFFLISFSPIKD